jgi:hypothetical protein
MMTINCSFSIFHFPLFQDKAHQKRKSQEDKHQNIARQRRLAEQEKYKKISL